MAGPEEQARAEIDRLLSAAGWSVPNYKASNLHAARGVALREFPLEDDYGVNCDGYRIRTQVSEAGGKADSGYYVDLRHKLRTEIFPGRTEVPKTLIFAADDSHAEDIVSIVREEFGKGNEFAQKITYRTTGETLERLIAAFRNSYHPGIAVTVDNIPTDADIEALEIVRYMRTVKGRALFEQENGRAYAFLTRKTCKSITPDTKARDRVHSGSHVEAA